MTEHDLNKEPIDRKGGMASGSTSMNEPVKEKVREGAQNVREGWQDFKMKVKSKWSDIKDNDLDRYQTNRKDLVGHIGERTRGDRSLIERDVDALARETNYRFD